MFSTSSNIPPDPPRDKCLDSFPRTLRRDRRLNITARLAWLMTTLAYKSGYASMAAARLAAELQCTVKAVCRSRQKLVQLELFLPGNNWRYDRVMLPDEDHKAHWRRVRADRRLDLTTRTVWVLADKTKQRGVTEMSLAELGGQLGTDRKRASWAVNRVQGLGHFTVSTGGGGRRNTYARYDTGAQQLEVIDDDDQEDADFDFGGYFRQPSPQRG